MNAAIAVRSRSFSARGLRRGQPSTRPWQPHGAQAPNQCRSWARRAPAKRWSGGRVSSRSSSRYVWCEMWALTLAGSLCGVCCFAAERANVLWISCEDISPDLGCYGDAYATSPDLPPLTEVGAGLTAALPAVTCELHEFPPCRALPVAQARLSSRLVTAGFETGTVESEQVRMATVRSDDACAVIDVRLPRGPLDMTASPLDVQGRELCGAYYMIL